MFIVLSSSSEFSLFPQRADFSHSFLTSSFAFKLLIVEGFEQSGQKHIDLFLNRFLTAQLLQRSAKQQDKFTAFITRFVQAHHRRLAGGGWLARCGAEGLEHFAAIL